MAQLTFLLTLKDRASYSTVWLQNNIHPEYRYLVVDGSLGDENYQLFSKLNLPNLEYIRYQCDSSVDIYLDKIVKALGRVLTPYVMLCDNDDFINFYGVQDCINELNAQKEVICVGGPLYATFESRKSEDCRYSLPFRIVSSSIDLSGEAGFKALKILYRKYSHVYYSIFRTEVCGKIWHDIQGLNITDLYVIELLHAELAFSYGKYVETAKNHYLRLANPSSSQAKAYSETEITHTQKIFFDDEYRAQVLRASSHVANILKVDLKEFLGELKFFYIGKRMIPKFCEIVSLQIRSRLVAHLPYFKLPTIFAIINIFQRRA
jgi:glycosyltransferase domain-containing protein